MDKTVPVTKKILDSTENEYLKIFNEGDMLHSIFKEDLYGTLEIARACVARE